MTVAAFPPPAQDGRRDRNDDLRALATQGAHFVVCQEDKRPLYQEWETRKPALDEVLRLGPRGVGLVPASVGLVVVDVDSDTAQAGDRANDLIKRNVTRQVAATQTLGPALETVPSRSGGCHLFYPGFPFCLRRMAPLYTRGSPSARNFVRRTIVRLQRRSPQPAPTWSTSFQGVSQTPLLTCALSSPHAGFVTLQAARQPPGTGSAQILRSISPNSRRVRCPSASRSQ